jgi:hypothetical protein
MTPKEKANELANAMFNGSVFDYKGKEALKAEQNRAKQCALIAVDEIIGTGALGELWLSDKTDIQYWQEVKQEIEKL